MESDETCETIVAAMEISRDDDTEMLEEVIFDANEVANEVSITASVERSATISIPTSSGTPKTRKTKPSVTVNKAKPIQSNQSSILVTNQTPALAQFITSIRPPVLPGTNERMKPVVTNTKVVTAKKPLAIAPAPSPVTNTGVIVNKVIMTPGQPVLISSPVKCADNQKAGSSNTNVQNQQMFILSPMKPSTPSKLVQVRPKPTTTTIPLQSNSTQQKGDLKQIQIIRLVSVPNSANSTTTIQTTGTKTVTINKFPGMTTLTNANKTQSGVTTTLGGQKILMTTSSLKGATAATGAATAVVQSNQIPSAFLANSGGAPVIMVPAQFLQSQGHTVTSVQNKANTELNAANIKHVTFSTAPTISSIPQRTSYVPIAPSPNTAQTVLQPSQILAGLSGSKTAQNGGKTDSDANRPRKPCNCTKSQCLKLYCDCFANGEFCHACNCVNCANNLDHEEDRQKAIKQCLERNPHAFHPKIGKGRGDITERRHTKGCNCRRSGCLKNYCECYEAKILCSDLCKCIQCKNYEDSYERKTLMHLADAAEVRSAQQSVASKAKLWGNDFTAKLPIRVTDKGDRLPCSFITSEVLEATCQCLLATAEDGERLKMNYAKIEEKILEEFGSCLTKIIETANKARKY